PSPIRRSRPSFTTAASPCTRISSGWSSPARMGDAPLTLRELRAIPVSRLTGVGGALEERLAIMEIESVLDVLQHYPRRYIDRTHRSEIAARAVGEEAPVFGEVLRVHGRRTRNGRALVEVVVTDGT